MKADVNDTLRNEGVDAVRARHDRAKTYHRDIGLGVVERMPPLKRMFIREAAGFTGELPKLLRGEML